MSEQASQFRSSETLPRDPDQPFLIAYRAGKGPVVFEALWDEKEKVWKTRYTWVPVGSPDILGWAPMPEWTGLAA